jgi:hypothetical protein
MSDFFEEDEPVAEVVAAFEAGEHAVTGREPRASLSLLLLRDVERVELSVNDIWALEHLLYERLSESARTRGLDDKAAVLAAASSSYLAPLRDDLGDVVARDLVERIAASPVGVAVLARAEKVARSVDDAVA